MSESNMGENQEHKGSRESCQRATWERTKRHSTRIPDLAERGIIVKAGEKGGEYGTGHFWIVTRPGKSLTGIFIFPLLTDFDT